MWFLEFIFEWDPHTSLLPNILHRPTHWRRQQGGSDNDKKMLPWKFN